VKSALIRVAISGAGGLFVYFLGGGGGPAFLAGVILGFAFSSTLSLSARLS
jgi:hypothetical protein